MKIIYLTKKKIKLNNTWKLNITLLITLLLSIHTVHSAKTIDQNLDVGAIDGTHAVNLSGAFTYTIPIKIPEGTMGMQPNLSLNYSSQSGNGIAGYGWNLSGMSAISRVNKSIYYDVETSAPDLGYDDGLTLDGKRIFYEPQANIIEDNKKVRAYYSKIEDFQRIYTADNELLENFTVKTKDGKTIEYGNSPDSKLKAGTVTLMWYINKVTDRNGNYMTYHYTKYGRQVVLSKIEYTGNGNTKPYTKVNFTYGNRTDKSHAFMAGSKIENYKLLSNIKIETNSQHYKSYQLLYEANHFNYLVGFQEWGTPITANGKGRLNSLTFDYGDSIGAGGTGSSVEVLNFNTDPKFNGLPKSQTDTKKWVFIPGNFNGDGLQDFIGMQIEIDKRGILKDVADYTKISLFINKNKDGSTGFEERDISGIPANAFNKKLVQHLSSGFDEYVENSNMPLAGVSVMFGDINGDNIDDIVTQRFAGETYIYGYIQSTGGVGEYSYVDELKVRPNSIAKLVDVDSDGRLELFVLDAASNQSENSRTYITSFGDRQDFYCDDFPLSTTDLSKWELFTKDFEGAGKTHLVAKISGEQFSRSLYFDVLRGSGCGGVSFTQNNTEGSDSPPPNSYHIHANRVDFNGDGKEDDYVLLYFGSNNIHVNINNTIIETNVPTPFGADNEILTADLNMDGFTDIIKISKGSQDKVTFYINKGEGTEYTIISRELGNKFFNKKDNFFEGEEDLILVTDIDGDGIQELFLKRPDLAAPKILSLNFDRENRFLTNVHDSYANQTKVHYTTLSNEDNYTFTPNSSSINSTFPYRAINGAISVVSEVEFSTNVVNQFSSKEYAYENLMVHMWGKGMLGFSKVTETDNLNKTKTESFFELKSERAIMVPDKTVTSLKDGNTYKPINENTFTYSFGLLTMPTRHWLRLDENASIDHTNKTKTITKYFGYDNDGNPKYVRTEIFDMKTTPNALRHETLKESFYKDCKWWITYLPETIKTTLNRKSYTGGNARTVKYEYNVTNGNLEKETVDPPQASGEISTNQLITTYSGHDKFGNPVKTTLEAYNDPVKRSTTVIFDKTGRFVTQRYNNNAKVEIIEYDPKWGLPTSVTDIDENETQYTYDNYGRIKSTTNYLSKTSTKTYDWEIKDTEFDTGYSISTVFKIVNRNANASNTIDYFDQFERNVLSATQKFGTGDFVYAFKKFDNRGRKIKESAPFIDKSVGYEITINEFTYDDLNRIKNSKTIKENDKGILSENMVTYDYMENAGDPARTVKVSGTNIIDKTTTVDATGKVASVTDDGGTLSYKYNNFNELVEVKDGSNNVLTTSKYDIHGRQTELTDINAGTTTYAYNPFNELISQTDAKGNTTETMYDNFGRIKTKTITDSDNEKVTYQYTYYGANQIGGALQLKSEVTSNGFSTVYVYDTKGRLKDRTDDETLSDKSFKTSRTYDGNGNIKTINYPDNFIVNYTYDAVTNALKKATANNSVIYELTATNQYGQITDYKYSNGKIPVSHTFEFGMPTSTKAKNGTLFNWTYKFDQANGNLLERSDVVKNNQTETFGYDDLHRLTHINDIENAKISYSYNGNINNKHDAGDYTYNQPQGKINAVTGITNTSNAIPLLTEEISYTSFDRPGEIKEGAVSYELFYGPQNQRKKTVMNNNGQKTTRYYSGSYELLIEGDEETSIYYLSFANSIDAIYVKKGNVKQTFYTFTDYLGSILKVVDANGNTKEEQSFDAWGRKRNPTNWQLYTTPGQAQPKTLKWLNRGYTGHEHLYEFGLINMNNRLYDPIVGRMLAVDNFVANPESTQAYNRYSYAMNNPLSYVDPSGEVVIAPILIGVAIGAYSGYQVGKAQGATGNDLFGYALLGGVVGGLAGGIGIGVSSSISAGIGSVSGGFVGTTIGGGVAGGINGFGMAAISGGNVGKGFINGAISGLVAGAVGAGLGVKAPSFSKASLAGRYAGKALYAGVTGAATAGAGMFAGDLADNGRIDLSGNDYLRGIGKGAALGAGISLGYSAYDYTTWDRHSAANKISILKKEFGHSNLQYDSADKNYGGYLWGTDEIKLGAAALANKAIARNTMVHELQHYRDFTSGTPFNRNLLEHNAHLLDMKMAPSQGLPGRYWTESRGVLQTHYSYSGPFPKTFGPGQLWYNIFR